MLEKRVQILQKRQSETYMEMCACLEERLGVFMLISISVVW